MVGDFLLSNRQVFAPEGQLGRWILPYRDVRRGDVVVFYHDRPSLMVKRVVGIPGDRLRIVSGHVYIDGSELNEPYARIGERAHGVVGEVFPPPSYSDPNMDPEWWNEMQRLTRNGELTIPPREYFVLGDNRDHSDDSRFWGFVPRHAIFARPLVIYFSFRTPSPAEARMRPDVKLEKESSDHLAKLTGFARWSRIFHVVH